MASSPRERSRNVTRTWNIRARTSLEQTDTAQASAYRHYHRYASDTPQIRHGRIQRGDRGSGPPPPPGIARLLIFVILKFSFRPHLGIWTPPPPPPLRKRSGSAHVHEYMTKLLIVTFTWRIRSTCCVAFLYMALTYARRIGTAGLWYVLVKIVAPQSASCTSCVAKNDQECELRILFNLGG